MHAFNWLSFFRGRQLSKPNATAKPQVEALEERLTPSGTPTVDLTTHGAIGTVNDAIFRQFDAQPTGTGVINSFVRLQSIKGAVQQGYNSDHRSVQFDENTSKQFTRGLSLSDVPVVNLGGIEYREFLLDINQKASQPLLSLDELRIYMGNAGNLSGYDAGSQQLAGLNAVYDLDAGADNWIMLDSRLNQGSGKGDMLAYIPNSLFKDGSYVYLYSKFGVNYTPNAGFEEWAAGKDTLTADAGQISGFVFSQATDGTLTKLANQLVFIDANGNGMFDSNEVFTPTNTNGYYEFDELATGLGAYSTYKVRILPNPLTVTETVEGTSQTYPYDVSLETDGQVVTDVDFYIHLPDQPPPPPDRAPPA